MFRTIRRVLRLVRVALFELSESERRQMSAALQRLVRKGDHDKGR